MKIDPDLLRRRLEEGASLVSIAEEMGCSRQAVHNYCRYHGLTDPPERLKGVWRSWLREQKIKGRSNADIAAELGVSKSDVAGLLRHYGLESNRARLDVETSMCLLNCRL